jgi:hypothetical protein
MGEGSLYPKGRNPLNNKQRGRWEKSSQQQTKEKTGEGSPTLKEEILSITNQGVDVRRFSYPKGRNPLSTKQGEDRRRFSFTKGRNPLSITNQGVDGRRFSYHKGRNPLSTTNQGEDRRRFSYTKGRNLLSTTNQGEGSTLKEEILSQ